MLSRSSLRSSLRSILRSLATAQIICMLLWYSHFPYDSLHHSVCKCNIYIFTEDLRPCIVFNICTLQGENHLDKHQKSVLRGAKCNLILPPLTKIMKKVELAIHLSFLINSPESTTKIYLQSCHIEN